MFKKMLATPVDPPQRVGSTGIIDPCMVCKYCCLKCSSLLVIHWRYLTRQTGPRDRHVQYCLYSDMYKKLEHIGTAV